MAENRQILLASMPRGPLELSHFEASEGPIPKPGDGEVLCRNLALTIGAGQRAALQSSKGYGGAPQIATPMQGSTIARVEASNDPGFSPGDHVWGSLGWQDYSVTAGGELTKIDAKADPALYLGVLGTNGLTAYVGLLDIGAPKPGETVVVSAAAGSVGHVVGQIARIKGCKVVGTAGSDEKCRMLTEELGFDAAVNYKSEDFRTQFKGATPERIDVYFDNTGGDVLGSALFRMNQGGRIVCCGVVSQYDTATPGPGPAGIPGLLVTFSVRMEGFIVFNHQDRFAAARDDLLGWIQSGELKPLVCEYARLEEAPQAFIDMLAGRTTGTTIVRIA